MVSGSVTLCALCAGAQPSIARYAHQIILVCFLCFSIIKLIFILNGRNSEYFIRSFFLFIIILIFFKVLNSLSIIKSEYYSDRH
jgi:hypothetical protein